MVRIPIILIILTITMLDTGCDNSHKIKAVRTVEHRLDPGENSITYVGHATVLIHLGNLNIVTDPVFGDYIGWFAKRNIAPGIKFEELPPIDAILISHEHADHLDKPTLKKFAKDIPVITPKGLGKKLTNLGFGDVRELSWWESTMIKEATITAAPARHILSKSSSYIVEGSGTVFFTGDTGLFDGFKEIGQRFKINLALLPIGDYHPRLWFIPGFKEMTRARHMAPGDIPEAMEMLKANMVIPIHWGTFKISGTRLDEPVEWLEKIIRGRKLEEKVFILKHGETKAF